MKLALCLIGCLFAAPAVMAQSDDRGLDVALTRQAIALSNAFIAKSQGDWDGAMALAEPAGLVAVDLIEWQRLRAGEGDFEATLDFLKRRPDWPGLPLLRKRSEASIPDGFAPGRLIAFFAEQAPRTLVGSLRLADAFTAVGDTDRARVEVRRAWVAFAGTEGHEAEILAKYSDALVDLHAARMDAMLWQGALNAAARGLPFVDQGAGIAAQTRIALQTDAEDLDAYFTALPSALAKDAGIRYDHFKWLISKRRSGQARDILLEQSSSATALGQPEKWADQRLRFARNALSDDEFITAYRLAANHHLESGSKFAELEFLAGFLALRKLDRADVALYHFERHASAVTSPISLGRTHYWQGRAFEALGKSDAAQAAYRNGAKHQTAFYGLLSAEKAGIPLDPKLTGSEVFAGAYSAEFTKSSVYQAAQILLDAGQTRIGVRFLTHLSESLSRNEVGQMASLAKAADLPQVALLIGKRGVQYGSLIEAAYYPLHPLVDHVSGIPTEMALAIARRESEFFADAQSGVGAMGLMQLMPATAREVAGQIGVPFTESRLKTDPNYNAKLGSGYLNGLYRTFGNSPVQISAAYNAGPSRPKRWMKERGDPRRGQVDVIDWIEQIPFAETRNYVMRVTEALPIYRARLTGETGPVEFTKLLIGEYITPLPPLRVIAPATVMRPVARPVVPATE